MAGRFCVSILILIGKYSLSSCRFIPIIIMIVLPENACIFVLFFSDFHSSCRLVCVCIFLMWFMCAVIWPLFFIFLFLGIIYLRSHLGKYLSVDSFGNVLCESDERDAGSRFQISITEDASGRWALRNESRGYFLGGTPDKLVCTAKAPSKGEFWTVHLAARPQVIPQKCSKSIDCRVIFTPETDLQFDRFALNSPFGRWWWRYTRKREKQTELL